VADRRREVVHVHGGPHPHHDVSHAWFIPDRVGSRSPEVQTTDDEEDAMTDDETRTGEQPVERGAAEDAAGVPVTPTDVEASRTPPSVPDDPEIRDDASGAAGGSSGGTGGTSGMQGHPDAS
jgi:hypothetical protein